MNPDSKNSSETGSPSVSADPSVQLKALVAMGQALLRTQPEARHGAIHYSVRGRLLWLASFAERWLGFTRGLTAELVHRCQAQQVPAAAGVLPRQFKRLDMPHVLWLAASADPDELRGHLGLGGARLYFRAMPAVPLRMMEDRHLYLLETLINQPGSVRELRSRMNQAPETLEHDIARLLLVGAITTRPPSSATSWPVWERESRPLVPVDSETPSGWQTPKPPTQSHPFG